MRRVTEGILNWVYGNFPYLRSNRLEEVIFLIQYLGFGQYSLTRQGNAEAGRPRSAASWEALGREHPEFFRVMSGSGAVTLGYRYYLRSEDGETAALKPEIVQTLIQNAMSLYERQAKRVDVWKTWLTMIGAILAAVASIANLFLK